MVFYYKLNNVIINFESKTSDINKVRTSFIKSLNRNGTNINDYLINNGYDIEKCRICKLSYPPLDVKIKLINNEISIESFSVKKKVYCYGSNKDCYGLKLNSNSFEFLSLIEGISIDEAKIELKKRNKSPFYKENWDNISDYKKSQSRSIEYYRNKYGDTIGKEKYKNHIDKISYQNSLQRYIDEFGIIEGKRIFNEIGLSKDTMSMEFFLKKNDYDYGKSYFEYEERKKSVNVSLSSFIEKNGYELGMSKHISRSLKLSSIYTPILRASKESMKIFNPLIDYIIENYDISKSDIFVGDGDSSEYMITYNGFNRLYDFTIPKYNIIIEYNGISFHPKKENIDIWKPVRGNITSLDMYNRQQEKIEIAKMKGFHVMEIWSDDNDAYNKCVNFIKKIIR